MCVFDSYSILINYKNFAKNIFYLIFFKSTIYFLSKNWMEKQFILDYKNYILQVKTRCFKAWNPPSVIKQGKKRHFQGPIGRFLFHASHHDWSQEGRHWILTPWIRTLGRNTTPWIFPKVATAIRVWPFLKTFSSLLS